MSIVEKITERLLVEVSGPCDCWNRECPVHSGSRRCPNKATQEVMEDDSRNRFEFCDGCADEAIEAGDFTSVG